MKKFLMVMLVLCMASAVNAAIVISVDGQLDLDEITIAPSDTVTIDVYNTGGSTPIDFLAYLDFYTKSEGTYSLSNDHLGLGAGDLPASYIMYDGGYDNDEIEITQAWAVGTPETTGAIFLIDLHCEGEGDVFVELWDGRVGYTAPVDTLTIHQVPEPMTIALLGLGGLFLRRRK